MPLWEGRLTMANTILPLVCGGDAALCQITLTNHLLLLGSLKLQDLTLTDGFCPLQVE